MVLFAMWIATLPLCGWTRARGSVVWISRGYGRASRRRTVRAPATQEWQGTHRSSQCQTEPTTKAAACANRRGTAGGRCSDTRRPNTVSSESEATLDRSPRASIPGIERFRLWPRDNRNVQPPGFARGPTYSALHPHSRGRLARMSGVHSQ